VLHQSQNGCIILVCWSTSDSVNEFKIGSHCCVNLSVAYPLNSSILHINCLCYCTVFDTPALSIHIFFYEKNVQMPPINEVECSLTTLTFVVTPLPSFILLLWYPPIATPFRLSKKVPHEKAICYLYSTPKVVEHSLTTPTRMGCAGPSQVSFLSCTILVKPPFSSMPGY
jgi:hypothetical protein